VFDRSVVGHIGDMRVNQSRALSELPGSLKSSVSTFRPAMTVQPVERSATPTAWPIPLPPPVTIAVRMLFDIKWGSLATLHDFGDQLSTLQKQKIFASFWE
jgi:hypothetical protein